MPTGLDYSDPECDYSVIAIKREATREHQTLDSSNRKSGRYSSFSVKSIITGLNASQNSST